MAARKTGRAVAYDRRRRPGPHESEVQVRDAGSASTRDDKSGWDETDEAADETFPASDATAKY